MPGPRQSGMAVSGPRRGAEVADGLRSDVADVAFVVAEPDVLLADVFRARRRGGYAGEGGVIPERRQFTPSCPGLTRASMRKIRLVVCAKLLSVPKRTVERRGRTRQ